MAFHRLQKLGEMKFQRIVNELMRGTPAQTLARLIQQDWGDAQNVGEETLAKQLKRLHTAITNGAFGGDLAQYAGLQASVRIKRFRGSTLSSLDHLWELVNIQRNRIEVMMTKEEALGRPLPALTKALNLQFELVLGIQKIRFDLGLDEYKRTVPLTASQLAVAMAEYRRRTDEQLYEAYAVANDIFAERSILTPPESPENS